jgi:hypothetical protein
VIELSSISLDSFKTYQDAAIAITAALGSQKVITSADISNKVVNFIMDQVKAGLKVRNE